MKSALRTAYFNYDKDKLFPTFNIDVVKVGYETDGTTETTTLTDTAKIVYTITLTTPLPSYMLEPGTIPFGTSLPKKIDGSGLWSECSTSGNACGVTYERTTASTKMITGDYLISGDFCGNGTTQHATLAFQASQSQILSALSTTFPCFSRKITFGRYVTSYNTGAGLDFTIKFPGFTADMTGFAMTDSTLAGGGTKPFTMTTANV